MSDKRWDAIEITYRLSIAQAMLKTDDFTLSMLNWEHDNQLAEAIKAALKMVKVDYVGRPVDQHVEPFGQILLFLMACDAATLADLLEEEVTKLSNFAQNLQLVEFMELLINNLRGVKPAITRKEVELKGT